MQIRVRTKGGKLKLQGKAELPKVSSFPTIEIQLDSEDPIVVGSTLSQVPSEARQQVECMLTTLRVYSLLGSCSCDFDKLLALVSQSEDLPYYYTSLVHTREANYQSDFYGSFHDAKRKFTQFCQANGAVWGTLFLEKSGAPVFFYSSEKTENNN